MEELLFGYELRRLRRAAGHSLKAFAQLVHYDPSYISKLENGLKRPTHDVAIACDNVLDSGRRLQSLISMWQPSLRIAENDTTNITPEGVLIFESLLSTFIQADATLGPHAAIGGVREQSKVITKLISGAPSSIRHDLLRLGVRYAELAGWLLQDSEDLKSATVWSLRALDMAAELGDPQLLSYCWMRRSNIASDAGLATESLTLARAALRDATRLTPTLRAVAFRQLANAAVLNGQADECAHAIDSALLELNHSNDDAPDSIATYCSDSYVRSEGAACWTKLGHLDSAIKLLVDAIKQWPNGQQRDRSLAQARLANAYLLDGEIEQACSEAAEALVLLQSVRSMRATRELRRLQQSLRAHTSIRPAAELLMQLRGML
jgi:transcriptional regulator with XRE-family HTH domain